MKWDNNHGSKISKKTIFIKGVFPTILQLMRSMQNTMLPEASAGFQSDHYSHALSAGFDQMSFFEPFYCCSCNSMVSVFSLLSLKNAAITLSNS